MSQNLNTGGALIRTGQRTGQKSFFCKSGQARKFWRPLIGRATQKVNKKSQNWTGHSYFWPVLISAPPVTSSKKHEIGIESVGNLFKPQRP